jgi:FlaA1/EpsC-like NDP-sugar epimerase
VRRAAIPGAGESIERASIRLRDAAARAAAHLRGRHLFVLDIGAIGVAVYCSLSLCHDHWAGAADVTGCIPMAAILLAVRMATNIAFGLYSRRWRYASVPELERIVGAVGIGSLFAAVIWFAVVGSARPELMDIVRRSFWPTEMLLSVALLGGGRFGIRAVSEWTPGRHRGAESDRHTLLYGAGETGAMVARWAQRTPGCGVEPVGFLDDDASLAGELVAGLKVFGGLGSLDRAVTATGADTVLVTMPSAPGLAVRRVVDAALDRRLEVRTVPALSDLVDGSVDAYRVRTVHVEDLLRRPIVTERAAAVHGIIRDRTVMITGAAGSIGAELARQVYAIGPRRLVLVDRAESPLYLLERELETRRDHGRGSGELRLCLRNVASRGPIAALVRAEGPSVIFHAAAYKHVPVLEDHPSEAAQVNIGGTLALLDAATFAGVERFVFVSTDKAVRPSNAMGASKRIAEMLVADCARRTGRAYVSVRFGNVLGSTGSVVPIFREQLEAGEPLTITDPEMTRFFMTIPEAAWLILDAAALGQAGGDLFILDMGAPVRILDLARDLVRLAGRDPDSQAIEYTGLRPGEKLHEQLCYDGEQAEATPSDKVLRLSAQAPQPTVRDDVLRILRLATGENEARVRAVLLDYASGFERVAGRAGPEASDAVPSFPRAELDDELLAGVAR